ncbi:MAG: tRNA (uridine(54)-C5)-methyltransferase TrmA [Halioglobus sp.]|nr:tRNA (uridine(54)-C5)-methyltransferase TrmA [Halioglobus sp.]|tara:strand:- start:2526 stop:3644 length:1119 start_codon:yes stop_codon:yes gene_type:complete
MPLSAVQPERYDILLRDKVAAVSALLAPFAPPAPQVFASTPSGYRMRAEFRVWHDGDALDYVMFRREEPKTPVPIDSFPVAAGSIQALMPVLREYLRGEPLLRRKLFQVEFMATLHGELLLTLVYHRPLQEDWEAAAQALRAALAPDFGDIALVGRSRRQKRVLGRDWISEELPIEGRQYRYRQYEQSFTQPNAAVNIHMIEWACARAADIRGGDLLELYCGNGNFTLPLSHHFDHVIATELSKRSAQAARENLADNGIGNVQLVRLSAEEVTQAMHGEREFRRLAALPQPLRDYALDTLFVDPPRAGLDEDTLRMAAAFEHILYISCNPVTLAQNLEHLDASHRVSSFALFDQFPYTEHMECGVLLQRRAN